MQAELESRRDSEVAAPATYRPEEIGVRVGIHANELAVRSYDVGGQEVVDRQAVLAD
jgi:hypothetical protein